MPTGKYTRRADAGDAIRQGIERRKAQGLSFGRTRLYTLTQATCEFCQQPFEYKHYPQHAPRSYCGPRCHMAHEREKRRKVPNDFALLYDLYWNQNQTTTEIAAYFDTDHSVVKRRMIQLGIPRRKVGCSRLTACTFPNCSEPVHKVKHASNGSYYGSLCLYHRTLHRKVLSGRHGAKRRMAYKQATPSWVNMKEVDAVYREAARLTIETGAQHHVDHIVPLRHRLVCGLHVPTNLQVLTMRENLVKHNKFSNHESTPPSHAATAGALQP